MSFGTRARRVFAALAPFALLLAVTAVFYGPSVAHDALPFTPFADTAFHVQAASAWAAGVEEGAWWPRWASELNRGWGAPLFVFYPPVAHALAAWLAPGGDVLAGLRRASVLFAVLPGLVFFAVARTRVPVPAALAGAFFYALLPYRAVDFYQRFALAEFAAFVFIPPVFHLVARATESPSRPTGPVLALRLAVASAGLALTHLVTAWMTGLVLLVYVGVRLAWRPTRARIGRCALVLAGAALGAALLAAGYVVPALAERQWAHFEHLTEDPRFDWRRNFSFRDEVAYGYGRAPIKPWVNASSAGQMLVALAAFAVAAPLLRRGDAAGLETASQGAVAGLAFALQVPLSAPIWEHVPELPTVQFPWRFAGLQGFAACALLSLAAARVQALGPGGRRTALALVLAAATLPALAVSGSALAAAELRFDAEVAARRAGDVIFEYLPRGVADWRSFHRRAAAQAPSVTVVEGAARIHSVHWGAQRRLFSVEAASDSRVRVRTFAWPGWRARIDGLPAELVPGGPERALELALPAGRHDVELFFSATPLRAAARWTSAAAALVAAGLALAARRRSVSARSAPPPFTGP